MVRRIAILLFGLSLQAMLAACTSDHIIDIQGSDYQGLYSAQTTFPVTSGIEPIYLKLRASNTRVDFLQQVPSGKYIFFENHQITGPDSVAVESDVSTVVLGIGMIGGARATDDKLSIEAFIGATHTDFNADVRFQSGSSVYIRDKIKALYIDAGFWYEIAERFSLGLAFAMSLNGEVSGFNQIDMAMKYRVLPHLEVVVGLRDYTYNYNEGDDRSGIELQSQGPFASLNFPF